MLGGFGDYRSFRGYKRTAAMQARRVRGILKKKNSGEAQPSSGKSPPSPGFREEGGVYHWRPDPARDTKKDLNALHLPGAILSLLISPWGVWKQ